MKKLIPALCMLLVAASLLGTSTFAWFSMNETVTATGMSVTATSDKFFLEIKGEADSDFGISGTATLNATLLPVAHDEFASKSDVESKAKWFFQYSDDPTVYNSNLTPAKTVETSGNELIDTYVAKTTYKVKLHAGAVETAYDLYISNVTIPANKGIKLIIVAGDKVLEFAGNESFTFNTSNVLFDTITTSEQEVTAYVYINGNDSNVTTEKLSTLTGAVSFTMTAFETDTH